MFFFESRGNGSQAQTGGALPGRGADLSPPENKEFVLEPGFSNQRRYEFAPGRESLVWGNLSIQEQVLLTAIYASYQSPAGRQLGREIVAAVCQSQPSGGQRVHRLEELSPDQIREVVENFKNDPKDALGVMRSNLINIVRDKTASSEVGSERAEGYLKRRLMRYYDASVLLEMRLDRAAFPPNMDPNASAIPGVLPYLPDGYSDMGKSSEIDGGYRSREKIRLDKGQDMADAKAVLCSILWRVGKMTDANGNPVKENSSVAKLYIVGQIANHLYRKMRYNGAISPLAQAGGFSVLINDVYNAEGGVCRHHAIQGQEYMQRLGVTSRLYKNSLSYGGRVLGHHASNLVRINNSWYLLDITNPSSKHIFFCPLSEEERHKLEPVGKSILATDADGIQRSYHVQPVAFHRIRPGC